jgi:nucleotide-binding universal stress UspA family protein
MRTTTMSESDGLGARGSGAADHDGAPAPPAAAAAETGRPEQPSHFCDRTAGAEEREEAMSGRRILVGTDFSPASTEAFREALEMAKGARGLLLIAHVLEPAVPFAPEGYLLPQTYDELEAAVRSVAEAKMKTLLARARREDVRARGLLLRGAPHEAIARAARTHRVGRVVVGTHGRRGFSRLFLGSVAARLIPVAPCSVTIVPGKRPARRSS